MAKINFGKIGEHEIERAQSADPFAAQTGGVMVPAPKIEQHLHRSLMLIDPAEIIGGMEEEYASDEGGIATAYKAISEGRQLVDLARVMKDSRPKSMPSIVVAPASLSRKSVFLRATEDGFRLSQTKRAAFGWSMTFPVGAYMPSKVEVAYRRTTVPHIPLRVRNRVENNLSNKLVFWEVDGWKNLGDKLEDLRVTDPALLEHVAGDLYAVLATWEFTDLELAALGGKG